MHPAQGTCWGVVKRKEKEREEREVDVGDISTEILEQPKEKLHLLLQDIILTLW